MSGWRMAPSAMGNKSFPSCPHSNNAIWHGLKVCGASVKARSWTSCLSSFCLGDPQCPTEGMLSCCVFVLGFLLRPMKLRLSRLHRRTCDVNGPLLCLAGVWIIFCPSSVSASQHLGSVSSCSTQIRCAFCRFFSSARWYFSQNRRPAYVSRLRTPT